MSKEMRKSVIPVATRPDTKHEIGKVYKQQVDGCSPFSERLLTLQTPARNFGNFFYFPY